MRKFKFFWIIKYGFAWTVPLVLFSLALIPEFQPQAHKITLENMNNLKKWIKVYQKNFKISNPTLRAIVEYSATQGAMISAYDRYGYKLDIHYLDSSTTLIKSWGNINFSNKQHSLAKNLFLAPKNWVERFPVVIHSYPQPPVLYQPAQLLSSTSYNKNYSARLFVHHKTKSRSLVVVHNDEQRDPIFLQTFHQPEEFIWFPGSSLLAFTSHPGFSPKGPLHIYDVERDELRTVKFGEESGIVHTQSTPSKLFVAALAGAEEDKLYVYLTPHLSRPLHPDHIFATRYLYQVQVTFPQGRFRAEAHSMVEDKTARPLRREYSAPKVGAGGALQKMWFDLKVTGPIEQNINKWHEFVLRAQKEHSPMLPYALITLVSLCEQASTLHKAYNATLSQQMQRNALLYSEIIAKTPTFPTWLRLVGWETWDRLKLGEKTALSHITPLPHPPP